MKIADIRHGRSYVGRKQSRPRYLSIRKVVDYYASGIRRPSGAVIYLVAWIEVGHGRVSRGVCTEETFARWASHEALSDV